MLSQFINDEKGFKIENYILEDIIIKNYFVFPFTFNNNWTFTVLEVKVIVLISGSAKWVEIITLLIF